MFLKFKKKKKFYLFFILFSMSYLLSFGQIIIKNAEGKDITGTEQTGTEELPYNFLITNSGSKDIEIIMTVTNIDFPEGAKWIQICGNGTCLAFTKDLTVEQTIGSQTLLIQAGTTSDIKADFHVNYDGGDIVKHCSASVKFSEKGNLSNNSTCSIVYNKGVSVSDISLNKNFELYPNPASDYITINSNMQGESIFVLRNILGKEIFKTDISDSQIKKKINISGLEPGVYLYNVVNNKKTVVSRKLVINR